MCLPNTSRIKCHFKKFFFEHKISQTTVHKQKTQYQILSLYFLDLWNTIKLYFARSHCIFPAKEILFLKIGFFKIFYILYILVYLQN